MPVLTRAQKRPADEAPEIDDSRKEKKPGSGTHSTAQASLKKKEQQTRWKSTERQRAPPEKKAAVRATNVLQQQARRADLPDEDKAAELARNAAQHQAMRADLPDEDRAAEQARNTAQHAARFASMLPVEQQDFDALKAATEAQRVAAMSPAEQQEFTARKVERNAQRVAAMSPAEQQAFHARQVENEAQRVADLPPDRMETRSAAKRRAERERVERMVPEQLEAYHTQHEQGATRRRADYAQSPRVVSEATRQGKPTCDINQHLEYCTQGGSTPGHYGAQDVLDEMEKSSTDFEDRWKQAKLYEAKLRERMYDTRPCACCGIRVPEASMQRDVREGPESPLNLLISVESDKHPNPTRVRLANGTQDYVLHSSYAGEPTVSLCNPCHRQLTRSPEPRLPRLCLKTVDVGSRPKGRLLADDGDKVELPPLSVVERLVVSPVRHSRYLTTAYDQKSHQSRSVGLSGHITAFSKPTPQQLDEALLQHFPASLAELGELVQLVLVTADSKEAALEKARNIEELKVNGRLVHLWCKHITEAWSKLDLPLLQASKPLLRATYTCLSIIILNLRGIWRTEPSAFSKKSTFQLRKNKFDPKRARFVRNDFCALLHSPVAAYDGLGSRFLLAGRVRVINSSQYGALRRPLV